MEAGMHKLFTSLAAAAALGLLSSTAQACDLYESAQVTASVAQVPETVAMSIYSGTPPVIVEDEAPTDAAPTIECPDGEADCTPPSQ
jgi:hypothetical protein